MSKFTEVSHEAFQAAWEQHGLKPEEGVVSDAVTLLDKEGAEAAVAGDNGTFGPYRYWVRDDLLLAK